MSGFQVCERVRAAGNHIPIVSSTARDSEDARIQGLELGGDDYMTKPFSVREFIQCVRAIFLRRGVWYRQEPAVGCVVSFGRIRWTLPLTLRRPRAAPLNSRRKSAWC